MEEFLPECQREIRARCFHPSGMFVPFAASDIEQSIAERFEQQVGRHPDHTALRTPCDMLTYAELNRKANSIAHALLALRGSDLEPAGLLLANGASFVASSLGVLKAGKIHLPLESTFPRARLTYMLGQSQATVVLTDDANVPLARELSRLPLINIDRLDGRLATDNPGLALAPDRVAGLAYTSGSTGRPKGIVWNNRGVLHAVMRHTNMYRVCERDRFVMFRASLRSFLYALLNGSTYFPVDLHREGPDRTMRRMSEERITICRGAVSALRWLAETPDGTDRFPDLRLILVFGEPAYAADVELFRKRFGGHFILAGSLGCMEFDDYAYFYVDKDSVLPGGVVPAGYPIPDSHLSLICDETPPTGPQPAGEIVIRSRYNAVGYWRRPDLTEEAFLPDPAGGDEPLFKTGDMARTGPDGCLFHAGRKDFQVKILGHRVEVAEVETALLELKRFKQAVVVAQDSASGEKRLVAYLVPVDPEPPQTAELRRALSEKLPEFMIPSAFITVGGMPLTATGKVDRLALMQPRTARPDLETPFAAPRTDLECRIAAIWAEVLGLDRVGVHDSFLDLGGDSLLASRVMSRISAHLGVRLALRDLFRASTVAEFGQLIADDSPCSSPVRNRDD